MRTLHLELSLAAVLAVISGSYVLGQSLEADSPCARCAREMKIDPASLEGALSLYVGALARGDRKLISNYSARYSLDSKRRRIYRTVAEQTKLVDQMVGQAIRSFHLCSHMTSTAELSYPEAQREHTIIGCIKYVDGANERSAHISVIAYRNRGRWIFSPLLVPEDPFRGKVPESKPILVPMEAPPPPVSSNKRLQRTGISVRVIDNLPQAQLSPGR